VTERKISNTNLLEACENIFKYDGKGAKRRGEVTERKMGNMHLVKQARLALNEAGKRAEKG
jgi:hypothetical protein